MQTHQEWLDGENLPDDSKSEQERVVIFSCALLYQKQEAGRVISKIFTCVVTDCEDDEFIIKAEAERFVHEREKDEIKDMNLVIWQFRKAEIGI